MSQYITLRIENIIQETDDAVTIVFQSPDKKIDYLPGQFLTLIIDLEGEQHRRSYSLSSSPYTDKNLAVTIKKIATGKISAHLLSSLKIGNTIQVLPPMGTFTLKVDSKNKRDVVMIGAGSGITPLISMAKSVLSQEPNSKVYLIYGNRNESSVIFKSTLEKLKRDYNDRLNMVQIFSQPTLSGNANVGRLNQSSIIKLLENFKGLQIQKADYYICGPHGLMEEAVKSFQVLKISADKIHKESFAAVPVPAADPALSVSGGLPGEITDQQVTILYQGSEYKFIVPKGKTILEAALKEKIDLPYSCQSGMCTACMGKCTNGKVKLNDPDGLSEREIQQGFVLTCVGQPMSSGVTIEID